MFGRVGGGPGLQPNRAMKVIQDWPMFVAAAKTKTLRPVLHASTPSNIGKKESANHTLHPLPCCFQELTVIKELAQRATLSRPPSKAQLVSVKRHSTVRGIVDIRLHAIYGIEGLV